MKIYNTLTKQKEEFVPLKEGKVSMLLDYTSRPGASIADPWYTGNFDITYNDIVEGCEGFLEYLKDKGEI